VASDSNISKTSIRYLKTSCAYLEGQLRLSARIRKYTQSGKCNKCPGSGTKQSRAVELPPIRVWNIPGKIQTAGFTAVNCLQSRVSEKAIAILPVINYID
jgi:hypothetical protein